MYLYHATDHIVYRLPFELYLCFSSISQMSVREFISSAAYSGVSEDDPLECAYSYLVIARESLNRLSVATGNADFRLPIKEGEEG